MDDYSSAFVSRCLDTKRLHAQERKIAAMHLGGITIECLLKKMCFIYHGIANWGDVSVRSRTIVQNPKHRISNAIRLISSLHMRVNASPQLMNAIRKVQEPCGQDYILWRYQGVEPSQGDFDDWYSSYLTLLKWLILQSKTI